MRREARAAVDALAAAADVADAVAPPRAPRPPRRRLSLQRQLLLSIVLPLAMLAALDAWSSYRNAAQTATEILDRMLLGSARIIGEQLRVEDGVVIADLPPAALELFQSDSGDRVYYRIATAEGQLLLGHAELPPPPGSLRSEEARPFDAVFRNQPIRALAFAQPLFGAGAGRLVIIEVAETLHERSRLAQGIWKNTVAQQLLMLLLTIALLALGLRRGLRPLLQLRDRVQRRQPGSLEPLDPSGVPAELAPLAGAINDYVRRLDLHMSAHSRFIAYASHQLRTPLTVLNTQLTYARRSGEARVAAEALPAIHKGLRHAIRIVNQLLTFTSAEAGRSRGSSLELCDLGAIVRAVLEDLAGFARQREIDLGFEQHADPPGVRGAAPMLRELVVNLVDNAVRYTPVGGRVTAVVARRADGGAELRVEDNGPGIAPQDHERAFERFSRLRDDDSDGCGLGLAIVREIAEAAQATVQLGAPAQGGGLVVRVDFPAPGAAATA